MDTKRLYVDFHVLQTVPPSCVNRDDTGSPKTAVYGGATRARVSSQAWKHAIRKMFAEEMADMVETGKRTLKATDLVAGELAALAPELDDARLKKDAKKALENAGIKLKDDNNAALLFLSTAQARALARLAAEDCEEKDDYKKALKENPSVDMALFGRMVASDPSLNYDAAAQVAHSISTHAVQNEFDYFTAVDDCAPEDSAGAGHLGTVEYNSSTCIAMLPSTWWNWCTCLGLKRQPRLSGCSAKPSSAPCPPESRTALPTAPCRMLSMSPCGRISL